MRNSYEKQPEPIGYHGARLRMYVPILSACTHILGVGSVGAFANAIGSALCCIRMLLCIPLDQIGSDSINLIMKTIMKHYKPIPELTRG